MSRFNQFAKYWASRGHTVTVITGTSSRMSGSKLEKSSSGEHENIRIFRAYSFSGYNKNFFYRFLSYGTFFFSSLWMLIWCGKQDIVIASSPPLSVGITGLIASVLKRAPLIFEIRDLWPDFAVDAGVLKSKILIRAAFSLEKFLYKEADCINVLTPAFADVLHNKKGVVKHKMIYVPNGADLDLMVPGSGQSIRKKYQWENKFVVMYVGSHGLANNLDVIIDAAELLKNETHIVFVLIGDGMLKKNLVQKVQHKKIGNVVFLDPVSKEHIGEYINACDVGIATLKKVYTTTYPNKIFDYMACAKPIIVSIDGAAKHLVVDEAQAGFYVKAEDAKELSSVVEKIVRRKDEWVNFGKNGYDYVQKHFSREKLAKKYEESMINLIDKKK